MTDEEMREPLIKHLGAEAWLELDVEEPGTREDRPCIETSTDPVPIRGEPLSTIWWRGKQWAVTKMGIERLDGGYYIAANRLMEQFEFHPWPAHIADKIWADAA